MNPTIPGLPDEQAEGLPARASLLQKVSLNQILFNRANRPGTCTRVKLVLKGMMHAGSTWKCSLPPDTSIAIAQMT